MQDPHDDLERMLRRYRPAGPNRALRSRVLSVAAPATTRGAWRLMIFRSAVAALLLLALGLHVAADRMNQATAMRIGIGPVLWTAEAEQAAQMMESGDNGRTYIAVCLMASGGGAPTNGG